MEKDPIMDASSIDGISDDSRVRMSEHGTLANGVAESSQRKEHCSFSTDLWLGEKFLDSMIALQIHAGAHGEDAGLDLDSTLKANLRDFLYGQCCEHLHAEGSSKHLDPSRMKTNFRHTLLSWIGHVVHRGMANEEALIRSAIPRFMTTPSNDTRSQWYDDPRAHDEWPPAHSPGQREGGGGSPPTAFTRPIRQHHAELVVERQTLANGGGPSSRQNGSPNASATAQESNAVSQGGSPRSNGSPPPPTDLSKYTSLLYENGTHHSQTPKWTYRDLSTVDHPCFSSSISFRGVTAEAIARKKKDAQHTASFKVCEQLQLQPL